MSTLADFLYKPPKPEPVPIPTIGLDGVPPVTSADIIAGRGGWKNAMLLHKEISAAERAERRERAREFLHPTLIGPEEPDFDSEDM